MKRSKSSHQWMQRHINDEFVRRSKKEGYRSRAAYKLLEIQERDRCIKPNQVIIDLGAAPGGWLQVVKKIVGSNGIVVGLDLLEIQPLQGVKRIQGDFLSNEVLEQLLSELKNRQADLVISDMAPNMTGIASVDQLRSVHLSELALHFCNQCLKPGGKFICKAFQGEGFDAFIREVKSHFKNVLTRKPKASRPASREVYLVAKGYHQ